MTAGEVFAAFADTWNAGDGRIVLLVSFDGTAERPGQADTGRRA